MTEELEERQRNHESKTKLIWEVKWALFSFSVATQLYSHLHLHDMLALTDVSEWVVFSSFAQ